VVGRRLGFVAGHPLADELLVVEVVVDDVADDAVYPDRVVARFDLAVLVGVLGNLYLAGVKDQQVRAVTDVLLDTRRQHGVGLRGVRAGQEDTVREFEVLRADGCGPVAVRLCQSRHRRGVTEAVAVVDVVRAEDLPGELPHQVVLLVSRLRGGDERQRFTTVLVPDTAQPLGYPCEGLVPRRLAELPVFITD